MIKRLVALALMTVSFTAMAAIGPAAARGGGPGNQGGFGYHGGHRGGFDHHGGQPGSGSPHGCGYRYCSTELH
jgi:hypothetical protein